jgi:penicillin-binding protein 1A
LKKFRIVKNTDNYIKVLKSKVWPSTDKSAPKHQRLALLLWKIFAIAVLSGFLFYMSIKVNFLNLYGSLPDLRQLESPKVAVASELYSSDGVLIGKYYRENRSPVTYEQIPQNLINALIATEDIRYYEHSGIDFQSIGSVAWFLLQDNNRGGGSTITQQLAKNLFKIRKEDSQGLLGEVPGVKTGIYKLKEWITAVNIEKAYTKEEILTMYLNTVDFGSNSFGIKTAAKTFFNKTPLELEPQESAVLIGLLKATTFYSPFSNPENSITRRNVVLGQMAKYNFLSQQEHDSLSQLPLDLDPNIENHVDGPEKYFRLTINNYLQEWCEKNGYDLYMDGLKIYTTIDSRIQKHAEDAVHERMKNLQKKFYAHWKGRNPWVDEKNNELPNFLDQAVTRTEYYKALKKKYGNKEAVIDSLLNEPKPMKIFTWEGEADTLMSTIDSLKHYKHLLHAGFMTMDPFTGHIKAWVGGINYNNFKYDHVKQAMRQPGSTFKPFVYAAAIEKGYSPCFKMVDQPITIKYVENGEKKSWSPRNADRSFSYQPMTLRWAMGRSVNSITAQLTEKLGSDQQNGWDAVIELARRMGIDTAGKRLESVPSIGLGSSDVNLYEMVGAYCAFVNEGIWNEPLLVARIEDHNGNIIHQFSAKKQRVLSEETAFLMVHMLKGSLEEPGGTSQALFQYNLFKGNEFGGKTGTSSNQSDGWFIGVTKDLVSGAWVGGEDRSIHFRTTSTGEGSKTALPIYGIFMEKLYADKELGITMGYFPKPKVRITKKYLCRTYLPKPDTTVTSPEETIDVDFIGPVQE